MKLAIDSMSVVPPFEQLRVQLRDLVASGGLTPGARLPTVRRLAEDLGLAPNTVARAYRELESESIIETRGRNGTYVSSHGDPATRRAQEAAATFVHQIRQLGVDPLDALAIVSAALQEQRID